MFYTYIISNFLKLNFSILVEGHDNQRHVETGASGVFVETWRGWTAGWLSGKLDVF